MKSIISFYGSHNSAIALYINGHIDIIEIERFTNIKNGAISQYKVINNPAATLSYIMNWIKKTYNIREFDKCVHMNTDVIYDNVVYCMEKYIPAKEYVSSHHHESHAAGAFYQSPYQNALIFSFDGGGNDGMFNVYLANRQDGVVRLEQVINPVYNNPHIYYDLGFPYMIFGHYFNDIKLEALSDGNLVYPGKIMGLASYGNVNEEWLPYFIDFYKSGPSGINYTEKLLELQNNIDVIFDINQRLEGQVAYDVAATSQKAFEECFLEVALPYMNEYSNLPLCITGGCGLNIILNTRIVKEFNKEVFVGPNPNDCGIAAGMLLNELKPEEPVDLTYSGIPLLDMDAITDYYQDYPARILTDEKEFNPYFYENIDVLVNDLVSGKIVGIVRGNSEHGPRALGNRSILCNPTLPDMKDILNAKVKNREWYRPFAPVVRLEDVSKYFEWTSEARWMSFCPTVKEEWKDILSAITHVDGTARVQTVTKEQNEWLYNLLTEFEKQTGVGILLNTSFNVAGKPILSTVKDALTIYNTTQLDCLLIEELYFRKDGYMQ